jgi:hypothetical protein
MSCDHHDGRGCSLGLFGGRPSPGVCATCDQYQGRPRGLGDVVHTVIKSTGLDRLAPEGCGCSKRRNWLNSLGGKPPRNGEISTDVENPPEFL